MFQKNVKMKLFLKSLVIQKGIKIKNDLFNQTKTFF